KGLSAIEKLIQSKKAVFEAGHNGLQAYHACAIQSHLHMVVENGCGAMEASEIAAESQGFAWKWGGQLVQKWIWRWLTHRELLVSLRGQHTKIFSIINDPLVCAELQSFLRSKKWSMDPKKLAEFSKKNMVTQVAEKYLCHIIETEMPQGLKKYLDLELFPRIHLKVAKGVSFCTAHHWLHHEGFKYTEHKKSFWVLEGEHTLKKKGVGHGMHQSDIICSTYGWLEKASQSLEYGKNYDGYWTGELFVKQAWLAKKIIPAFKELHGPEYQALIMVDNSQGHSAYSTDALLVSQMNMQPGGKQAHMHDGWFMRNGERIVQPMIFPLEHPKFPDMPKGMKERYLRNNCDYTFKTLKENLPKALASVELKTIQLWEHWMIWWMEAYRSGMDAKMAQMQVKKFSSCIYTSHRCIPETLACQFDT
ncbi:hypothetical protein BDQ12DRAFT_617331, partial [Crucibulum laeve]